MSTTAPNARHILVRLADAKLPDALLATLRDEVVMAGWMRASGVLADVQLRAFDPRAAGLASPRRIAGPVHAVVLEGSIGLAGGDVSCGLRTVLARETESGLETLAGEIVEARAVALEVVVTALDDVTATRVVDASGVALLVPGGAQPAAAARPAPAPAPAAGAPSAWAETARASEPEPPKPAPPKPSPTFSAGAIPPRPVKPAAFDDNVVWPDAGDVVEHFAFGRCEVIKSDGDRLHVRLGKDGRIKEISLDMLKVTPLPPEEGQTTKHFKLDRKL
jgi:predicted DNA-binding protein with PD1-like motif